MNVTRRFYCEYLICDIHPVPNQNLSGRGSLSSQHPEQPHPKRRYVMPIRSCSCYKQEVLHDNGYHGFATYINCFSGTQLMCKAHLKPARLKKRLVVYEVRWCTEGMFLLRNWFLRYKSTTKGINFIKVRFRYSIVQERNKVCIQWANSIKIGQTCKAIGREECTIKRQTELCVLWWKVITKLPYQDTYKRVFCLGAGSFLMKWIIRGQIASKQFNSDSGWHISIQSDFKMLTSLKRLSLG